jgi:hypothetical protein
MRRAQDQLTSLFFTLGRMGRDVTALAAGKTT